MKLKEPVIKKSALSPTVLIAGGAGFIGSRLAEFLLSKDTRVIVVDNFKTGKDIYVNPLLENPKFALYNANINQGIPKKIESIDYIIHLAGVESYLYNRDKLNLDSLLTNATGTKNLLDLAHKSSAKFLLVSSVDVYQGVISRMNLEHYFGETPEEERQYSFSEAKRFAEALVWEYYKKNSTNVRIVRVPEVYGPRMNLNSSGTLGRLLKQLMENENFDVFGEGVEKEYYLFISDAISGITKALFENNTSGQIFTLAPKEPHAVLETAYLLKGLADREIIINFRSSSLNKTHTTQSITDRGNIKVLKWSAKTSYKDGIRKTLKWFGYDINEHSFKPYKIVEDRKKEKRSISSLITKPAEIAANVTKGICSVKEDLPTPHKKANLPKLPKIKFPKMKTELTVAFSTLAVLISLFTVVPALQIYINTRGGVKDLERTPVLLTQLETEQAKKSAEAAFSKFNKSKSALVKLRWAFILTGNEQAYANNINLISSVTYFSKGAYNIAKATSPFTELWEMLKPNSSQVFDKEKFEESQIYFSKASNNLQRAEAEIRNVTASKEKRAAQIDLYKQILRETTSTISFADAIARAAPDLLGAEDTLKRYMILFQNSNEIRPTGGFIGSYAIVEIQNGRISSITIDDIYNPDGQLDIKGINVTPPAPISKYIGETRLHIRNANWNPDFTKSSYDIRSLYSQVSGKSIDGVFAVDLYLVKNLLNVTGPIYLTAYGEEINSENLYERTQYHSEFNYKSGSSQKKDFLTILGGKLLESIFSLPKEKMPDLFSKLKNSLDEKHLLMYLSDSSLNAKLKELGWDGGIVKTTGDYLYVVNANVGGTKANYFVENSMDYTVSSNTRDGLLRGMLKLTYKHTGEDNSWPGGPYKNYVRVLTQNGTKLTSASISTGGNKEQSILNSVVIEKEGTNDSYGIYFELNPQKEATIKVYYDLPQNLSVTDESKNYTLYWQKQPGTQNDKIKFTFMPPFGTEVVGGYKTEYSAILSEDAGFIIALE